MVYDRQILKILSDVGEKGISVHILAKHVYNMNCNLFSSPEFCDVHRYVQQYLLRNSKSPQALVESTGRRGFYRLNTQNPAYVRQMMLEFHEKKEKTKEEEENRQQDLSLDLFA